MIALVLATAVLAPSAQGYGPIGLLDAGRVIASTAAEIAKRDGVASGTGGTGNVSPLISLADAKRVMAAARADATKRGLSATIVIVDRYGELVLAQAGVDAEGAAVEEALTEARSVIDHGATPAHSALRARAAAAPLMLNGKIIGAIGDAGAAAGAVANAGAEVLK